MLLFTGSRVSIDKDGDERARDNGGQHHTKRILRKHTNACTRDSLLLEAVSLGHIKH